VVVIIDNASFDKRPIGVFDSGLGGLTALRQIYKALPCEQVVYFGDTGRVPYGTRSDETVIKYVNQDIRFISSFDIKLLLLACNTATSIALDRLKDSFGFPVIGVVENASTAAVNATKTGSVLVLGTSATIRSKSYIKRLNALNPAIEIYEQACPLLVPLVENGRYKVDDEIVRLILKEYLDPFKGKDIDTVILGCTHYPLLSEAVQRTVGDCVTLIDSGKEAVSSIHGMITPNEYADRRDDRFYVSDSVHNFEALAETLLGETIYGSVEKVDIDLY